MACRLAFPVLLITAIVSPAIRGGEPNTGSGGDHAVTVFQAEIQPLLAQKCGKCHSDRVRKGDLDLSSLRGLAAGGESGETLVGTSLEESYLWHLVHEREMPPADEPPLSEAEIRRIAAWLENDAQAALPDAIDDGVGFHDAMPILLLRCVTCHGPERQDGGLDIRSHASMLSGGDSGPAVVPGDADASRLIERIESEACPPRESLLKAFVRRPPQVELESLRRWIDGGAPAATIKPDVAGPTGDPLVSDEDRKHWAFRPPRRPAWGNSIDDFVERQLRQAGLDFSPQADRDTLIRRAYLDLIGMPPSLTQWRRWNETRDPAWYARMIDELLASPHYGERWGRYWLDLAGYADSEGGISADPIRQVAWKYRDYVIEAFNEDKPYDQFLLQQLAGDELIDHENADVITETMVKNLVATGFLRMGIDETGSRTMNFVPERLKVIDDAITIVSSGLMGMTMACARCHSHKYDPIPQRDYYRFKAIFQGALDEHDWKTFKNRRLRVATDEQRLRIAGVNPPLEAKVKKLQSRQRSLFVESQLALLRHHYPQQSEEDNRATLVAVKVADNQRTLPQKILVERLQRAELVAESDQPDFYNDAVAAIDRIEREIHELRVQMEPPATLRALWDVGRPSPTYLLRRGEHDKPGPLVGPGVPSVLTDGKTPFDASPPFPAGTPKTGRRLALARWLIEPDHPLTARVMVNRLWQHHFGNGLVKDPENFGVQSEDPTHPELLDFLAVEFVEQDWSVKTMHRQIMMSRTYRQLSRVTERHRLKDPQNRSLSRMPMRRLDAEALRDSLLLVAGKLDRTPGGLPDPVSVDRDGMVSVWPNRDGLWRRSVYLQYRRTEIPSMMDTFDYPRMGPNCISRTISIVSPQSLMMMNNGHVRHLAESLAARVSRLVDEGSESEAGDSRSEATVKLLYQLTTSRMPTPNEMRLGTEALADLCMAWNGDRQAALQTYCHALLNSAAFLYVD